MITTRFAPSPTGHLHIGGLRTALYSYLHARANNGKFLLRIEDTDIKRNSKEALHGILEAFKWANLEYDEPTLYQSKRTHIYQDYAKKLLESNKAYYCYLSQEELQTIRENRNENHAKLTRKYRDFKGEIPTNIKPSVRIKAPLQGEISFIDGVRGKISFKSSEIDDFVILRSDGMPTYNFVVAIDDALSGITDLLRGDDHISNTPKQIVVYEALGFEIPKFYHIPMICNEKGQKLSKRDGALSVLEYREAGILPEALLNFLFRLGYSHGDKEVFSMEEMLECFHAEKINNKASACNFSKLYWLNSEHIKSLDDERLCELLDLPELQNLIKDSKSRTSILLSEVKTRVNNLCDFKKDVLEILYAPSNRDLDQDKKESAYDKAMLDKLFTPQHKEILTNSLTSFAKHIESNANNTKENYKILINEFAKDLSNIKPSLFMQSLRLALLGKKGGIDLGACVFIIGYKETQERIEKFLDYLSRYKQA
ncbi:glutamate--tRNA ligase [Helicobacter muridarum]|uniref:Glutamate--tRNA ligase n=1 Tax=Helicobacter muridarum TaxID=216 RepID=A0A099TYL9_9HELI|nr:glutamate--tRNA ligase [Helicobacter muridarum]TLE01687.1 glutamate--tRNA ligase [Helicobacter muridarum]STQ86327.1 glutamyl-tRNA synthetase [Helicobacter muridarum]